MRKDKVKNWVRIIVGLFFAIVIGICALNIIVDPYMHYHKPLSDSYIWGDKRYANYGILKNWDYEILLAGSSMMANTSVCEAEELFGRKTVKASFAGGSYKEVNDAIEYAIKNNPELKTVIRSLDYYMTLDSWDKVNYENIPTYLYDDDYLNDFNYILNRNVTERSLLNILNSVRHAKGTSFDEYGVFDGPVGSDVLLSILDGIADNSANQEGLSNTERECVLTNIRKNVTNIAKQNPDIEFIYYFVPYSIAWWNGRYLMGDMNKYLEAEEIAIDEILTCDNIKLYSFVTEYDVVCDLNNYHDLEHFTKDINSYILRCLHDGKNKLHTENIDEYLTDRREFYETKHYYTSV